MLVIPPPLKCLRRWGPGPHKTPAPPQVPFSPPPPPQHECPAGTRPSSHSGHSSWPRVMPGAKLDADALPQRYQVPPVPGCGAPVLPGDTCSWQCQSAPAFLVPPCPCPAGGRAPLPGRAPNLQEGLAGTPTPSILPSPVWSRTATRAVPAVEGGVPRRRCKGSKEEGTHPHCSDSRARDRWPGHQAWA